MLIVNTDFLIEASAASEQGIFSPAEKNDTQGQDLSCGDRFMYHDLALFLVAIQKLASELQVGQRISQNPGLNQPT